MTFDYTFENDDDEVFFAAQPPYGYSQMRSFLSSDIVVSNKQFIKEVNLCRSLGGLKIPQINITDFHSEDVPLHHRKTIIICARMHPGESLSSYIAQVCYFNLNKISFYHILIIGSYRTPFKQ